MFLVLKEKKKKILSPHEETSGKQLKVDYKLHIKTLNIFLKLYELQVKKILKKWKLRKLVVFNSILRNFEGLTLIDGLWQRINYTDTAE